MGVLLVPGSYSDASNSLGNGTVSASAVDGLLGVSESEFDGAMAFEVASSGVCNTASYATMDDIGPSLSPHGAKPVTFIAMMAAYWRTIAVSLNGTVGGFDGGSSPPPVADTTDFENALNLPSPVRILCTLARSTFSSRC